MNKSLTDICSAVSIYFVEKARLNTPFYFCETKALAITHNSYVMIIGNGSDCQFPFHEFFFFYMELTGEARHLVTRR